MVFVEQNRLADVWRHHSYSFKESVDQEHQMLVTRKGVRIDRFGILFATLCPLRLAETGEEHTHGKILQSLQLVVVLMENVDAEYVQKRLRVCGIWCDLKSVLCDLISKRCGIWPKMRFHLTKISNITFLTVLRIGESSCSKDIYRDFIGHIINPGSRTDY